MSEFYLDIKAYFDSKKTASLVDAGFKEVSKGKLEKGLSTLSHQGIDARKVLENCGDINVRLDEARLTISVTVSALYDDILEFLRGFSQGSVKCLLINITDEDYLMNEVFGYVGGKKRNADTVCKHVREFDPDYALLDAVLYRRNKEVDELLAKGANPNIASYQPAIIYAARNKKKNIVESLIKAGADIDAVNELTGETALFTAIEMEDKKTVDLLLLYNAQANLANKEGITPLMSAARQGLIPAIKSLLIHGADINAKDNKGISALMHTGGTEESTPSILELLIAQGADVLATDNQGRSLLSFFNEANEELLLSLGAKPYIPVNEYTGDPCQDMATAIKYNHASKVKDLLAEGADPNCVSDQGEFLSPRTPVFTAIFRPEIMGQLLEHGGDLLARDNSGQTLLHAAALHGQFISAKILIKRGIDVNIPDGHQRTPLMLAAGHHGGMNDNHVEIVELLIKSGANISEGVLQRAFVVDNKTLQKKIISILVTAGAINNSRDKHALMKDAIRCQQSMVVELLLKDGLEITPCFLKDSIYYANLDVFCLLLEHGADVNIPCEEYTYRVTPLIQTCISLCGSWKKPSRSETKNLRAIFQILLDKCADISATDLAENTALLYLQAKKGFSDLSAELLERGANPDLFGHYDLTEFRVPISPEKLTPLMFAAAMGYTENVEIILKAGANPMLMDDEGRTAASYAKTAKRTNVLQILCECK